MIQTKKVLAMIALVGISLSNFSFDAHATQIGTGSVVGDSSFDTAIDWNDTFPGIATGQVTDIVITASVQPRLNMSISGDSIGLRGLFIRSFQ